MSDPLIERLRAIPSWRGKETLLNAADVIGADGGVTGTQAVEFLRLALELTWDGLTQSAEDLVVWKEMLNYGEFRPAIESALVEMEADERQRQLENQAA